MPSAFGRAAALVMPSRYRPVGMLSSGEGPAHAASRPRQLNATDQSAAWPQLSRGGDHLPAHDLQRPDLLHAGPPAQDRLDPQAIEPAQLAQQLARLRAAR